MAQAIYGTDNNWLNGAPAIIPLKSAGYRSALTNAWRPPVEHPRKYANRAGSP
ncbi:MAG: hypothetical protein R3F24_03825 [Gammaproteobacteria bacterium]